MYDSISKTDPIRAEVTKGVVESVRQWGRNYCAEWGINWNAAPGFCPGRKNFVVLSGLAGYSSDTRVVCQTNTVIRRQPSLKVSNCNIIVPAGESYNKIAFQAYNDKYRDNPAREFSRDDLSVPLINSTSDPDVLVADRNEETNSIQVPAKYEEPIKQKKRFFRPNSRRYHSYYYGGYSGSGYYRGYSKSYYRQY